MEALTTPDLLERVRRICAARGMNLVAAVTAEDYDAAQPCCRRAAGCMPDCGTVLLLASGGRACWEAVCSEQGKAPENPRRGYHPIDAWSESVANEVLAELDKEGIRGELHAADARPYLNFRQLAEMAGMGVISPVIGHLLHPEYGPWVSLRIAVLIEGQPFGTQLGEPLTDFDPCAACAKPCVCSCPADAYDGAGAKELMNCGEHRVEGGCSSGCGALRACPVGAEHGYSADEGHFRQAYSLQTIRRWIGDGWWRFVPESIRHRV